MFALYVNNSEKHASAIVKNEKTIETRTRRAIALMQAAGLRSGDRVAIITKAHVIGFCTVSGFKAYDSESDFYSDAVFHLVNIDSRYKYDDAKGKAGLIMTGAEACKPYPVPKADRPRGFCILQDQD